MADATGSGSESAGSLKALKIALVASDPRRRNSAARALLKLAEGDESLLGVLARAQPLPPVVARAFGERLGSPSYAVASTALGGLVGLPPELRGKWVPALLNHLGRFRNNSEWSWIIECLPPHFRRHKKLIEPVLRAGLESRYAFGPYSVFEVLQRVGPAAAALVPDVLAYVGRQKAFTNEEPHLIHIDPEGKKAVPGLIRLLGERRDTVRVQAANELAAYGPRAQAAVPALTELARREKGRGLPAVRRALGLIQQPPTAD